MGYIAFLVLVLTGAAVLCLAMFFRTKSIAVTGNERYSDKEIISASGIQLEQNVFSVDRKRTARQIEDAFSYLESVEVAPVLPTTMEIRVVESVPRLRVVNTETSYSLLSTRGRIIEQCVGLAEEGLPLVLGANFGWCDQGAYPERLPPEVTNKRHKEHRDATEEETEAVRVMQTLAYVVQASEASGMAELDYIDVSDRLSTSVLWDKRVLIRLGTELDLEHKFLFVKTILEEELDENFTGVVDVSTLSRNARGYTRQLAVEEFMDPFYLEHYYKY